MRVRFVFLSICLGASWVVGVAQVLQPRDPVSVPLAKNVTAADPFDIETGIYFRAYQDLFVADSIAIDFVRTQRNQDSRVRSFGVGSSTSYDMFIIGDVNKFSWVALVMADGSQETYARISSGSSYADGVFENKSSPDSFYGSRISWNGRGGWTVTMREGGGYTIQGCNANSKPGQCAVTEERNARGERLVIQRDGDGNIQRITSATGREWHREIQNLRHRGSDLPHIDHPKIAMMRDSIPSYKKRRAHFGELGRESMAAPFVRSLIDQIAACAGASRIAGFQNDEKSCIRKPSARFDGVTIQNSRDAVVLVRSQLL